MAVTSANSLVGRELLDRLSAAGVVTTALVRKPDDFPAGTTMITDWTRSGSTPEALAAARVVEPVPHSQGQR